MNTFLRTVSMICALSVLLVVGCSKGPKKASQAEAAKGMDDASTFNAGAMEGDPASKK